MIDIAGRESGRVAVIGAGLGGLAAAVRLRLRGFDVVVLEARDQPGGRAGVFRRSGYTFDAGPTVITAPHLIEELFTMAGRDPRDYYQLVPVDPFYRILFDDGSRFDYVGDEERLIEQIRAFEPRDVDGYRRLATLAREIFEVGYVRLGDQPFHDVRTMLRAAPDIVRLGGHRSVHSLVARHIRDERLQRAFSFEPLLVGGNPFHTSGIYLLIHWLERLWGVHYAMGGTTTIVAALLRLLGELGVDVRLSSPVERIETDAALRVRAVTLESGERVAADAVVANADPSMVYQHMLAPSVRRRHTDRAVARVRQSMSLFVGYFGATRTWPDVAHHTVVLGTRYRELLDDVFEKKRLADDFSLYLHAPTRSDPSMAPAGHEAMYVLSPVPNTRAGVDWSALGEGYFTRILESLESRVLPGLADALDLRFHVAPDYFERELRSMDGAAFGPEPRLTQSAWFRYHNRSPDVAGLFFVGAGTHPGGGIPGVLTGARVLDRLRIV